MRDGDGRRASGRVAVGVRAQVAGGGRHARGAHRVSRRDTTELARELFGVELSTGTVDTIIKRAGAALAAPRTRLERELKRSPVVYIDETGWKTGGDRRTLWGALTRTTAVFRIAAGRHASEAQTMLGERYDGIVERPRRPRRPRGSHAIAFSTWKSLVREQELSETEAIALVTALITSAA